MRSGLRALAAVTACLLLSAGCGGEAKRDLPKAPVTGTVTFSAKSLPGGTVIFQHETGEMIVAEFGADGKYSAEVPVGKNKVMVQSQTSSQTEQPADGGAPRGMEVFESHIPARYSNFGSSGLEVDVKEGGTTYDIAITD